MKHQIQDANRIEERLKKSLKEKQLNWERMEAKLAHLRKECDAKFIQLDALNNSPKYYVLFVLEMMAW